MPAMRNSELTALSPPDFCPDRCTKAAKAFAEASPEAQRKMQLLLNLRLQDLTTAQGKSLQTVMDEIGARAEARGLTPEILQSLLDDK